MLDGFSLRCGWGGWEEDHDTREKESDRNCKVCEFEESLGTRNASVC